MTKFRAVPFVCEMCEVPGLERARTSEGKWSAFCKACEQKFLGCITAWKMKASPLWWAGKK